MKRLSTIRGLVTVALLAIAYAGHTQNAGTVDPSFGAHDKGMIGANDEVFASALQPDGKILIGGRFSEYGGVRRKGLARLNADGSPDESFDPGAGFSGEHQYNLIIQAIAVQPDGKILVGGDFNSFDGSVAHALIRLNADGSLDASFDVGSGIGSDFTTLPAIHAITVQPDQKILVGGDFQRYNGASHSCLVRLNVDGSVDESFDTGSGVGRYVHKIVLRNDGKIYIGGYFASYNGVSAHDLALLNADGSLDATFSTQQGFDNRVNSFAIQPDGKLVVGGDFSAYNGTPVGRIARLNTDGSLDPGFNPGTGLLHPLVVSNGYAETVILQADGRAIICGYFMTYNGSIVNSIARINTDGTLDHTFGSKGMNRQVNNVMLQSDGKIIATGDFTSYDKTTRERVVRINTDGTNDESFNAGDTDHMNDGSPYGGPVNAIAVQSDGKTVAAGTFNTYQGKIRKGIARFNQDGSIDSGFDALSDLYQATLVELLLQEDGKILAAGNFSESDGSARSTVKRLNSDGSIDPTFATGTGFDGYIYTMALQPDGKVLVAGYYASYNGTPAVKLARLNTDGSFDATFQVGTGFSQSVESIAIQADGRIVVGGSFATVNGSSRPRIVRLNADGSVDNTFIVGSGFTGAVIALAIQEDGKILAGGTFASYNGTTLKNIARLNTDGSIDNTFSTGSGFDLRVVTLMSHEGKILAGGSFTTYNGTPLSGIIRLLEDGTPDNTFATAGTNRWIGAIAIQPDYRIMVGGYFYDYNGTKRSHIARVFGDRCNPPQNLTASPATQTRIDLSWTAASLATHYIVERSVGGAGFSQVADVNTTQYRDEAVTAGTQYTYRVIAVNGNGSSLPSTPASATTVQQKQSQTIDFATLPLKTYGDPNFNLTGKATSGLAVSYTSSNSEVASVHSNIVVIKAPGTTTITATQSGNAVYAEATPVSRTLTVDKARQQITFGGLPQTLPVTSDPFTLGGFSSSGLPISYSTDNASVAVVNANQVTIVGPGWVRITASQPGNTFYHEAEPVSKNLYVNKALQTITFDALPQKNEGDGTFTLEASASSGLAVSFSSSNTKVAMVHGDVVRIVGPGTTTIIASQPGNEVYEPAQPVQQALIVNSVVTAIGETVDDDRALSIFPNPVTTSVSISTRHLRLDQEVLVFVYNSYGQEVMKHESKGGEVLMLDLTSLPEGMYCFYITQGNNRWRRPVVKL